MCAENNPLLETSIYRDGAVAFEKIEHKHFMPALEKAIERAKKRIHTITSNPAIPTFENTVEALEISSDAVSHISSVFFNLFSAEADESLQQLAQKISPRLSAFSNDVLLDEALFKKVRQVHENLSDTLSPEQRMLSEKTYISFTRNGALLSENDKATLREIDEELAGLIPRFADHVRAATNAFEFRVTDENDLRGLPETIIDAAKICAEERDAPDAWVFTLEAPSYIPFMTYADDRGLRETCWRAFNTRALDGDHDNREVLIRIVTLRHQRAQLLGYDTHAHFVLEERMAVGPERVLVFLDKICEASRTVAERELEDLKTVQRESGRDMEIKPWDTAYYSEKLKKYRFDIDQEKLRPYFKLENLINGIFEHGKRLYDLAFRPIDDVPLYHPDVQVFEVTDTKKNQYMGLLYMDFFPRPTKRSGAWMSTLREQGLQEGKIRRPHVSIVCNFTKPTPNKPSLLTFDEVRTLFHEFGHALHTLLRDCTYTTLSGCNVYWDFVELPSQIMENWTLEKGFLDLFATHYETGEQIPETLAQKIKDSARFMAGSQCLRQTSFSLLDMAWHTTDPVQIHDIEGFEDKATRKTQWLPREAGTCFSTSFSHIFSGGYSAGYYSYKWAEALDADAFELFKKTVCLIKKPHNAFETASFQKEGLSIL